MPPLPSPSNSVAPLPSPPNHHTTTLSLTKTLTLHPRALEGAQTVPQGYGNRPFGPSPGIVVGIVIGSVIVFLLLLTVFYWCLQIGEGTATRTRNITGGSVTGRTASSVVSRHRRPPGSTRRHHRRSRHSPRHEKSEQHHRRERVRVERDEIVVEEEFGRSSPRLRSPSPSHASPVPSHVSPPRGAGSVLAASPPARATISVVSETDNVIIVEEERSAVRARGDSVLSQHTKRSEERRGSTKEDGHGSRVASRQSRANSRA